ncbi:ABC transporter substrate-binding protein [Diplocloster hominis]|uniref:ABC transporter substrate-binding protein n=1 Tax=Diplocloster hominis TaxID=3079010 RepID=UPI0031BB2471
MKAMKKAVTILVAGVMACSLLTACQSKPAKESAGTKTPEATADNTAAGESTPTPDLAGQEDKEPVTLSFMTMQTSYIEKQDYINEQLQKVYPNITLEFSHVADNYETTVKTKFAAGDPPDLFDWNGYLSNKTFAEAGYFVDITDDNLNANVLDQFKIAGEYDGRTYGIPTLVQASGLIYNEEAFEKAGIEKAPETLTELKEACEKLKAAGITPFSTGLKDVWVSHQLFWNVAGPNVGDFEEWYYAMAGGSASFLNDKTDKAFELIDIILANTVENPLSSDAANSAHMLATGKTAMCFMVSAQYPEYLKSNENVKLHMVPIPVSEDPADRVMEYEANGIVFAAATGSHVEEARNVLAWLGTPEGGGVLAEVNTSASPVKGVPSYGDPLITEASQWVENGGKTVGFIKTYWPSGLTSEVGKQLQSYVAGTIDKAAFFKNIDDAFVKLANGS